MILLSLISLLYLFAIILIVSVVGLLFGASKRKILIAIPTTIIGLPVFVGGIFLILKGPIQEGKILKNTALGPLLNLISPPNDLYQPICTVSLEPEKTEYILSFTNKYTGNHALMVSSPKPAREDQPDYSDVSVTFSVFDGNKELLKIGPEKASQFWGINDYGASIAWYKVPRDLPISKQLTAKVVISGNLHNFLERRGNTILKIQKFSDL